MDVEEEITKEASVSNVKKIFRKHKKCNNAKYDSRHDTSRHNTSRHNTSKHNTPKHKFGIFWKISIGYLIPVILIIMLGIMSYEKASTGLIGNYEDASNQTIGMTKNYLELIMSSIESTAMEYVNDKNFTNYVNGEWFDVTEAMNFIESATRKVSLDVSNDECLENIHVIPRAQYNLFTTSLKGSKGFYEQLEEEDELPVVADEKLSEAWLGYHKGIDKELQLNENSYFVSYVRTIRDFSSKNAVVVMDVSTQAMKDILDNLSFGENSISGLITSDGREISLDENGTVLTEHIFQQEELKPLIFNQDSEESSYVFYRGEEYLFMRTGIGDTNLYLCALVPKTLIMKQALEIRTIVFAFVLLASAAAIIVGIIISRGISRGVFRVSKELKQIASGDLTIEVLVKGRDEISDVAANTKKMIEGMRGLITKVSDVCTHVLNSSELVIRTSNEISCSTDNVSSALHEIDLGISQQAQDLQNCMSQVDDLSSSILVINRNIKETKNLANETQSKIAGSLDKMNQLSAKSSQTSDITERVVDNILALNKESNAISQIVNLIDEIAEQTNLLSLNASIEAARAGEAGRGFSVVSEEIKNLANHSKELAGQIKNIVSGIQLKTGETVTITEQAKQIVSEEKSVMYQTIEIFKEMEEGTKRLLDNMNKVNSDMEHMNTMRAVTLEAIENISAVSEETCAASGMVNETMQLQVNSVVDLQEVAKGLKVNAGNLEAAIAEFRIK